jgi:hypothetical protein
MRRLEILCPVIFLLALVRVEFSTAATITVGPNDCSAPTVNSAISSANPGDTVKLICTGTVNWTNTVTVSGGVELIGPGSMSTNSWPLVIDCSGGTQQPVIQITNASNQPLNRVSGLEFQNYVNTSGYLIWATGQGLGPSPYYGAYRIDNNYFNSINQVCRLMWLDSSAGEMTGLVDHNVIYDSEQIAPIESYAPTGLSLGQDAWDRPLNLGDAHALFIESNQWIVDNNGGWYSTGLEAPHGAGAKFVYRYNTWNCSKSFTTDFAGGHGPDIGNCGGVTGTRSMEIYGNTGTFSSSCYAGITIRSGTALVYNNAATSGQMYAGLWEDRASTSEIVGLDWPSLNYYKPCKQAPQISDFATCWPLPYGISACGSISGAHGGAGNVSSQCVGTLGTTFWNNSFAPGASNDGPNQTYVTLNREYWNASSGPQANLPATCTADGNTYYGTTDTNQLYKCTATDVWTLVYTAYTYPHPLTNDIQPPDGLRLLQ